MHDHCRWSLHERETGPAIGARMVSATTGTHTGEADLSRAAGGSSGRSWRTPSLSVHRDHGITVSQPRPGDYAVSEHMLRRVTVGVACSDLGALAGVARCTSPAVRSTPLQYCAVSSGCGQEPPPARSPRRVRRCNGTDSGWRDASMPGHHDEETGWLWPHRPGRKMKRLGCEEAGGKRPCV
jgi:hypothetical protein